MITLTGLSRRFGERVILDAVDLEVGAGEVVAVLGASGAGKSTLLRIVGGLDRAYAGTAQVDGVDLATMSDAELTELRALPSSALSPLLFPITSACSASESLSFCLDF